MLPHTAFHAPRNSPDSSDFPLQGNVPTEEIAQTIVFIDAFFHQTAAQLAEEQYFEPENGLTASAEAVMLDSECNGMYQISDALIDRSHITNLHLVVPSSPEQIQLGNAVLNLKTIDRYLHEFPIWRDALAVDAKIWIHGDAVLQNESGQALIQRLNQLTERSVYWSDRRF